VTAVTDGNNGTPTDHQRIGQALESVTEAADPERARRELIDFEKEEKIIFAVACRELSPQLQQNLGARWAALRKVIAN
jgi:hypothetical protein